MTVGRISVDLYAEQLGVPLNEVRSFRKSVGGTATTSRSPPHGSVITRPCSRLGDDPMGEYVRWALDTTFGVDTRYVGVNPSLPTPLAFATMEDPGEPVIVFYRSPQAPEMTIESADIDRDVVESVPVLWFPTSSLSAEPSRTTIHDLLGWRSRRTHTVLDLDWRPQFWRSPADATAELRHQVLDHVTMAIGNRAECEVAVGERDPDRRRRSCWLGNLGGDREAGWRWRARRDRDGVREQVRLSGRGRVRARARATRSAAALPWTAVGVGHRAQRASRNAAGASWRHA